MNNDLLSLLEESKTLNASIFSLIRLQLLSGLAAVCPEQITYREFKAVLQVTDGALYANLNALIEMRYIEKKAITVEGKELESYRITEEGLNEWKRVQLWLKKFLDGEGKKNETR